MTDRAIEAVRDNWTARAAAYNDFYERYAQDKREAWRAVCDKALHAAFPDRVEPLRVLDVGTGTGFLSTLLAELGHEVTAVDPSPAMLDYAREEARRRGVEIEFAGHGGHDVRDVAGAGGFDLVSARYVLWTLPDPVRALRAWRDVLAPGGALLLADGVWHTWGLDARRVLASLRPGADHRYLAKIVRDYAKIGRATPNWAGLTAAKAENLLRSAGFEPGDRVDHLLPEYAHPSSAAFHLRTARPRTEH